MIALDLGILLEFTKALAPPMAAIGIAALGLKSYRAQRRLDRRSEWYQNIHRVLGRAADRYRWAAAAHAAGDKERAQLRYRDMAATSMSLSGLLSEGFLFGLEADLVALRKLSLALEEVHRNIETVGYVSEEVAGRAAQECLEAADHLAAGFRREMGLRQIDLSSIDRRLKS